ncbi:MAG: sugar phosphate isomerase/epimerase [Opitutaceae bacterium]|mgnify:CR=1 FL=1|nr:sugar phosphate isomerase/epimerase [Opitutaceae bacterium]
MNDHITPSSPPPRCYSTLGSPKFTWTEVLKFAQSSGLSSVEIRCLEGGVVEPAKFDALLPATHQAKSDLATHGLTLAMMGTSVKLLDRTEDELSNLKRFAQVADELDCPWLRIFDGGSSRESPSDVTLNQTREFLSQWSQIRAAEDFRCDIAVETHDAMANLVISRAVVAALPQFNVLWDTHHTWRSGEDLAEYYDLVSDRTVHFHVKDSVDRPSKRKPFTYVEPGTGEFPWAELGSLLKDRRPDARVSFEWEQHWNPELANIESVMPAFIRMTDDWS